MKELAWAAIILYPVGLLALNVALLYAARHAILSDNPTLLSSSIAFLYREYEPHMFWWEIVEVARVSARLPGSKLPRSNRKWAIAAAGSGFW